MKTPTTLIIMDGFGINPGAKGNAIEALIDSLCKEMGVLKPKAHYLNSSEFLAQKENYKKDIQLGEKVILFSSYNTKHYLVFKTITQETKICHSLSLALEA